MHKEGSVCSFLLRQVSTVFSRRVVGLAALLVMSGITTASAESVNRAGKKSRTVTRAPAVAGACYRTHVSYYNPLDNSAMEGGSENRYTERIQSIQSAIRTGNPVTVAMDIHGEWGKQCNRADKRCTLLVCNKGFDRAFPKYRERFPAVPDNCFLAIVEDTGGRFYHKGTKKLDIASASRAHARAAPRDTEETTFQVVENPCGTGARARNCDLGKRWDPERHGFGDRCGFIEAQRREREMGHERSLETQLADWPAGREATTGVN